MPHISQNPSLDSLRYETQPAPKPLSQPAKAVCEAPKPVYGPQLSQDSAPKLCTKGQAGEAFPFVEDPAFEPHVNTDLLDDLHDSVGDKAFYTGAGAALGGALAMGKQVKVVVKVEDQVKLPHARLELRAALKENQEAKELDRMGTAALLNMQPGAEHTPRGAGARLTFKTDF